MALNEHQARFRVGGMDCAACATKIDTAVRRMPGVTDVNVSVTAGTMTLQHTASTDLAAVASKVTGLGYSVESLVGKAPAVKVATSDRHAPATVGDDDHDHDHDHDEDVKGLHGHDHGTFDGPWWKSPKGQLTIASGVALAVAFGINAVQPVIGPWVFIAAMLVGLVPIARRAVMAALAGTPFTIEMLMTVAAVGAVLIGAGEEGGHGRVPVPGRRAAGRRGRGQGAGKHPGADDPGPQDRAARGGRSNPRGAGRKPRSRYDDPRAAGRPHSGRRRYRRGRKRHRRGAGHRRKRAGAQGRRRQVFAGTVNGDGVLRVRVTAAAADNTIARIVKLVEEAQESQGPDRALHRPFLALLHARRGGCRRPGRDRSAAGFRRRLERMDLQGPCHPADRLPLRAGHLDAGGDRRLALGWRPARPADEGRRRAGRSWQDHRHRPRQDRHADGRQAEGHRHRRRRGHPSRDAVAGCSARSRFEPSAGHRHPAEGEGGGRARAAAAEAKPLGGKGVIGDVGGKDIFLGSPSRSRKQATLSCRPDGAESPRSTTRARPSPCCWSTTGSPV